MHAACSSAALQPKLLPALFWTALTPVRFYSFDHHCYSDKQRQLKLLHHKMTLQKDFLPLGLTVEQFWARMKHHSRNPRVLEYLYSCYQRCFGLLYTCEVLQL